jgi:hypothetical protein
LGLEKTRGQSRQKHRQATIEADPGFVKNTKAENNKAPTGRGFGCVFSEQLTPE